MRRYPSTALFVLFSVLAAALLSLSAGECPAAEFDASINVMAYDRDVTIKINNIQLSRIKGGQSHSVRLFLADDPRLKTLPADRQRAMKEMFCLVKGENTIEIAFQEKGKPSSPSQLTVTIDSGNYRVPVLKYVKDPGIKAGKAKGTFKIYADEPAGFRTVVLQ
jgi:hypothetical protein